jgi:hypothetical protein
MATDKVPDLSSTDMTFTVVTRSPDLFIDTRTSTGPKNSYAAVLGAVIDPQEATDVAPMLLARPGVRQVIASYLRAQNKPRAEDVGIAIFPATDMAASVFVPYGAVAVSGHKDRFRLYGAVSQTSVIMMGPATPYLTYPASTPVWLDVRAGGGTVRIAATHSIEDAWFDHSLRDDTAAARAIPDWIMHRIPVNNDDSEGGGTTVYEPAGGPAMLRLARAWMLPRIPKGSSAPLPTGYTGTPHQHPGIEAGAQLSSAEVRQVFRPSKEGDLLGFSGEDSDVQDVDFSGPDPQSGPVRLFQVIWNDPADYSGILNVETHRALRSPPEKAWWEFRDPVWLGHVLYVDIVLDGRVGLAPTILHCEIDWRTMTVIRAVPYGPLSPFEPPPRTQLRD